MFGRKGNDMRGAKNQNGYATGHDFCAIFTEDMTGLHLLALLLTADEGLAGQCFVEGLEDGIESNSVFRQWARSWAKRAIIKNAIKAVRPGLDDDQASAAQCFITGDPQKDHLVNLVTRLEPMERFAFVMSVLEGYSPAECASLLGCDVQSVIVARTQAMRELAATETKTHSPNAAMRLVLQPGNA